MTFNPYKIFFSVAYAAPTSGDVAEYDRKAAPYRIAKDNPEYSSAYQKIDDVMQRLINAAALPITFDYFLAPSPQWNAQAKLMGDQCKVLIHTGILNFDVINDKKENITFPAGFAHELSHCTSEFKKDLYANVSENLT